MSSYNLENHISLPYFTVRYFFIPLECKSIEIFVIFRSVLRYLMSIEKNAYRELYEDFLTVYVIVLVLLLFDFYTIEIFSI